MSIAGRLGIEPRFTASKAAVLPLDDLPINNLLFKITFIKHKMSLSPPLRWVAEEATTVRRTRNILF